MSAGLPLLTQVVAHPAVEEGRVAVSALEAPPVVAALTRATLDAPAGDAARVEVFRLQAKAARVLPGPIVGGVGLAALLAGVIVLLTE
jgi:hypothetical protein